MRASGVARAAPDAFTGGSFQSSSAPEVHFGLPSARKVALEITWPDGLRKHVGDVAADQRLTVTRTGG